ncbi:MAG: SGNH/GDSL hydrolase family protein [Sphingomonas sp.]
MKWVSRTCTRLAAVFSILCLAAPAAAKDHWVGSWARALYDGGTKDAATLDNATVRTVVRLSAGGPQLRLRFSNAFGDAPLVINSVSVAYAGQPGTGTIDPRSARAVTFGGAGAVTVPQGAYFYSDPVDLPVHGLSLVAVTFHLPHAPARLTAQGIGKGHSFVAHGVDPRAALLPDARPVDRIYQLDGIDVLSPGGTVAALGDSIPAASGAPLDGSGRWTDVLATRMQASPEWRGWGVANLGIAGGRVAREGTGPAAIARLDRDVLSRPNIRTIIVFEGVNDLGKLVREEPVTSATRAAVVRAIIQGYRQIIERAHDHGVRVVGATITPFTGNTHYRNDADAEADRQQVNAWIRAPGHFDAVIDFASVVADPTHPERLSPADDSGDHLHPSDKGQALLGATVPLAVLGGWAR